MFLEITIIILSFFVVFLLYFLYQQKRDKGKVNNLSSQFKNSITEIKSLKDLFLANFASSQASAKERFDYLDKSFFELNKIFSSSKRGMLGNSYLNELLGIILPKDKKVYQLEFTLKKLTDKGDGLRVDAIIFGSENKNNLAIDSKFPLDNYLLMIDEWRDKAVREQARKDFQNDLKKHIDKTSLYVSEEDSIYQAVMFIPSDAIYLTINELSFYEVVKQALAKKVWICSPTTLYIVLNQIILANRNWELHKSSDKILKNYLEIAKEFDRLDKRWREVSKSLISVAKKVNDFETTISKIIKKNEDLMNSSGKAIISSENIITSNEEPCFEISKEKLEE